MEVLSDRRADRPSPPLAVVSFSRIPAEGELVHIPMQVLFADAVKRAVQTALQEREEVLNNLGASRAA